ncbi:restriction endonuclease subunit S [Photobacterium phosphoreum]|uniref:restriction endonuclease subunit S n=1 Tax=Photobacterium phosphoreum TaxID=659 RepID=UPI000D1790C0|nr:restriction endonuclease subunit S [Photobacterium phosphoreum]PSU70746.1 restriction endonuclease subunit S [Photobacterium phosphoreum]
MSKYQAYPEYKDSGVEWANQIPQHWNSASLSKLFEIKAGGDLKVNYFSEEKDKDHPFPIYTNANDEKAVYGYTSKPFFKGNSITVSGRGEVGYAVYRDHPFDAIIRLLVLSPTKKLNLKFFTYFIKDVIDFQVESSAIGQLSTSQISPFKVVFPAVEEQTQIAAFLDHETAKIDTLIEKQQQLIELLKEKRQAVISHAVTKGLNPQAPMKDSGVEWLGEVPEHWELPRLKQIIQSGSSISYGIVQPGDALDEGVPFIQTTNISQGTLAREDLPKTSALIEKNYPRSRLMGGEVILGIRASIGAAYVVPNELRGVNLSRGIARIQPNNQISSEFLVWLFKTNAVEQYWGLSKQGSTFSEVSIETVREMNVLVPPMQEQQLICKELNLISNRYDQLINTALAQNTLLRERRTALISAAVTGKIDVRHFTSKDGVAPTTSSDTNEAQQEVTA